ncbi:MAG: exo-alpha-sialidase, partial [Thermoguttaceae bacterium]|nr:exo-alpha-sialidase [Thermoguttaceae bacterium]
VIPPREGEQAGFYHELHGVEAADGTIVVQIRNHNERNGGETLQTESADGGKTWSEIHSIGVWGHPSHLLRLADGRLVMTYGYRREGMGNRARVSSDNGKTWSEPIVISDDARITDVGYPSTVQLPDGTLLTVWYENMGTTCLRMATWKLN